MEPEIRTKSNAATSELSARREFVDQFYKRCPIPENEILLNQQLFLNRQAVSHVLYLDTIYKQILPIHGLVFELGVRWGRNLALLSNLRGIYEPFNHTRKIIGFDTFDGFTDVGTKDGESQTVSKGAYAVSKDYLNYLSGVLNYHQAESPLSHINKFELVKGDASVTVPEYINKNPHAVVALAYFDMDIYQPTFDCITALRDRMPKAPFWHLIVVVRLFRVKRLRFWKQSDCPIIA